MHLKDRQIRLRFARLGFAVLAALIAVVDHVGAGGTGERLIESVEARTAGEPTMAIVSLRQPARAQSAPIDLNTASIRELRNIPGLSRSQALAIRNARPYAGTEELVLRRVIPRRTYERISGLVTAVPLSQSALTDLNTASIRELKELPGIGQSRAFAIRNGRPYARTEDLLLRRIIAQRAYERIKPLVTVTAR